LIREQSATGLTDERDHVDQLDRVLEHITSDRLVELLRDLVDIPSPTGSEQAIGEYMLAHYERLGLRARGQELDEGRLNAVGILRGQGDGPSLMFNGHMDTSLTGDPAHDVSVLGEMHDGFRPQSWVENGYVRGLGAFNMKGALAAYLGMLEALVTADVPLAGDLVVAGVAGEIEKTPIRTLYRDYSGSLYRGAGCGTRYLVTHGVWTDYAIVGEPSALHINLAHPGYCWFEITMRGRFTRTTAIDRGRNAIKLMAQVVDALSEWGPRYTARKQQEWQERVDAHPYSVVKPNVNIGAVEGGWPFKPTWSTAVCKLYVDVRTLPGDSPRAIQRELEAVLAPLADGADNRIDVEMYMSNPGGEIARRDSPLVDCAALAVERIRGTRPATVPPEFGSYWCDMNILNRVGIEALTLGSGDERVAEWDGKGEYHAIDSLTDVCRIYSTIAVGLCGTVR
jgi:acetylornithine deacetylase